MRGNLSNKKLKEINQLLPSLNKRFEFATSCGLEVYANDLVKEEKLGISIVCLNDAGHRFRLARFSLHEAYANMYWYGKKSKEENHKLKAILFGKYYTDYAALLLYAIGEDIAAFIINFMNIHKDFIEFFKNPDNKKLLKKKNIYSKAAKIGIYLKTKEPNSRITNIINRLFLNENWKESIEYRNLWVHDKPPIIHGLGIEDDRTYKVKNIDGKRSISIGGGSKAKYKIDELFNIVLLASKALSDTLLELAEILLNKRENCSNEHFFPFCSQSFLGEQ